MLELLEARAIEGDTCDVDNTGIHNPSEEEIVGFKLRGRIVDIRLVLQVMMAIYGNASVAAVGRIRMV